MITFWRGRLRNGEAAFTTYPSLGPWELVKKRVPKETVWLHHTYAIMYLWSSPRFDTLHCVCQTGHWRNLLDLCTDHLCTLTLHRLNCNLFLSSGYPTHSPKSSSASFFLLPKNCKSALGQIRISQPHHYMGLNHGLSWKKEGAPHTAGCLQHLWFPPTPHPYSRHCRMSVFRWTFSAAVEKNLFFSFIYYHSFIYLIIKTRRWGERWELSFK